MPDPELPDEREEAAASHLRRLVADFLLGHLDVIVNDTVAVFPFSGPQPLDADYCARVGGLLLQALAMAVRDGRLDSRAGFIIDLQRLARERLLTTDRLFAFAYLTERTALDELALDEALGATAEPWALAARLVRRGSFDLLAAYSERTAQEPAEISVVDRLTTLYTRPVFEAVLGKELGRASRLGHPLALMLLDVDHLAAIDATYGYGVGDRILERLGILVRTYFRDLDWVARNAEDSILVLLPHTAQADALELAERLRATVEERLGFRDHRNNSRVRVTLSGGLVTLAVEPGDPIDVERLLAELGDALTRAKQAGRNRIEHTHLEPASYSVAEAARRLQCTAAAIRRLVAAGELPAFRAGRQLRLERGAVDTYSKPLVEESGV